MELTVFLAHAVATLLMTGVILVVQVVHYPLFRLVGEATYAAYQAAHMRRITWIVVPLMLVELAGAAVLPFYHPAGISPSLAWAGVLLVAVIWGSTGLLQVPLHRRLTRGFDAVTHRRLVATNGIRTAAWLLRSALAAALLFDVLSPTDTLP